MLEKQAVSLEDIYVPAKRRREIDSAKVAALAESILEQGQLVPIRVRRDGDRFVLVEGLHRLEACRSLGERSITSLIVQASIR